ncbi:MAG: NADH-quinone oxidoreductase subunit H [Phycisphaerales bacterium]|nr:NADH-quinone oxidoreductase subunit H [Phycisphaerales bacterium]
MDAPSFLTAQLIVNIVVILIVVHLLLGLAGYSTYGERKISAYIQDRIGPNRVGFDLGLPFLKFLRGLLGLGQPLADGLKFMLKEDYMPRGADKALFTLAPMVVAIPALIGFAVIPWGGTLSLPETITIPLLNWTIPGGDVVIAGANISVGIIYLLAVGSMAIYGITLAGWASNNKYAFLGALRASAQMISYEIPMGLCILTVLLMVGSLLPEKIIGYQVAHGWLVLAHPVAAVVFFICILAESNRTPFDNAECEQELVAGFHTEYSSMRYALFPLSEYIHMAVGSAFFTLLFLGGYHLPLGFIADQHLLHPENTSILAVLVKFGVFLGKAVGGVLTMMLVRWTIPRLKFDQVMQVGWQGLIPISLVVVVMTAVMVFYEKTTWPWMLAANALLTLVLLGLLPILPRATSNKKVRLAGSRFYPLEGERVRTAPTSAAAIEDRPSQGTVAV